MSSQNNKENREPALLVLEDGTCFEGVAAGASGVAVGEAVFNTSMSGYQEILTDPSYAGQLVTLTMPHIGNYGVNTADMESATIQAAGLIVRSISETPSNYRSEMSLPDWLADNEIVAITEIDTRALTRHLRDKGVMMAVIAHGATAEDAERWQKHLADQPDYGSGEFVGKVAHNEPLSVVVHPEVSGEEELGEARVELVPHDPDAGDERPHVVVIDYGVKFSILRNLDAQGLRLTLVPGSTSMDEIRELKPDGIMLSNGPGDPARLDDYLATVKGVVETYPTFGICLGHQLLARALGAETFKLPFGHRGPNQPVKNMSTGKIAMTSQNHGYAVRSETLPADLEVTHINLNDETVEGFRHKSLPVLSVQYHPEAGPGPHDAVDFFDDFAKMVREASA
ncbi:glutamine-hydrolyzing carbamoyl-phosphate synthase small subunit [Persicimonas caeni]|uniref:Carbamoyl phosphate synthase small chain n=1 Tax=Persicimonas caeni TaxID=2292766 RepID=A0A4Y6Q166_PERCE|nr:glutamine-hydrolyzing carbamoyl-phosphate synthase small subunit [Persicimonas caeni]QDG54328.1 glutamine-hydrolyzing carbamoyl-phosphate synthase small subunit [Persicimonas caeni]QED35549.1 glutamine-hydrolyzing carbamoyl-phosphate synthase small subunit [Persicimonas caeni]